jgi:NAD(P)-dependent dehydrogenase (short-subunit alcohol dehydrogenase family)
METARRFTLPDQLRFASLSGDRNPIHIDPLRSRRLLFGGPVVHGMHLVLWALDRVAAAGPPLATLARLEARFDAAALVGDDVTMEPPATVGGELRVRLRSGTRTLARLRLAPGAAGARWSNPGPPPAETCHELTPATIATAEGAVALGYDVDLCAELFPALAGFAPAQIAWLLASTRIVGMRVPGLHSIFTGVDASFDGASVADRLAYRTTAWDDRFGLVTLALSGGGDGRATALLRPRPVDQPELAVIAARVTPDRFAGASALIVGGSRGLGEAAAKLLGAGGAKVTLTYHQGAEEAGRVAAEINAAGGRAIALSFDATATDGPFDGGPLAPFTHVVYCAAPRIRKGGGTFDAALYDRYAEVFVAGLDRTLRRVEALLAAHATLLVPSTAYLDHREPGFAEYAAAKSAGEAVAREAARRLTAAGRKVRLLQPRFDRLRTDQTAQVGGDESEGSDPAEALLAVL